MLELKDSMGEKGEELFDTWMEHER